MRRLLIREPRNVVHVSAVTLWEIAIKRSLGKLQAPADINGLIEDEGFLPLAISLFHGERAGDLPLLRRDPFDRMLVAQAQAEGLDVITADTWFGQYGVRTINARQ
ncbi:MAG: type II toxin-antitoxin system VapC family toxin [Pseudohongiellaceae bacterium]